jgi:hypothetical protein
VIGNAVLVMKIATGECEDTKAAPKNTAAVELGSKGGQKGGKPHKGSGFNVLR